MYQSLAPFQMFGQGLYMVVTQKCFLCLSSVQNDGSLGYRGVLVIPGRTDHDATRKNRGKLLLISFGVSNPQEEEAAQY